MIYLGFTYPAYDRGTPERCLRVNGTDQQSARQAVEEAVRKEAYWNDPVEAHTVKRSEGWTRTSDVFAVGSISDEMEVQARPGFLDQFWFGELWEIDEHFCDIRICEYELTDDSTPEGVWAWTDWREPD